jgi:hypothetical protein
VYAVFVVICRVCRLVRLLQSFVVTSYKHQINPVINPNPSLHQHVATDVRSGIGLNCWIGTHVMNDLGGLGTSGSDHGKTGI